MLSSREPRLLVVKFGGTSVGNTEAISKAVEMIRIGTRTPVILPYRITDDLVAMLRKYHPVWVNTHFNHPDEFLAKDDDGNYLIDPDGPDGPAEPFTVDQPNFNFKSLKINVVLRWEYRPGSTLFVVWTQNRADHTYAGDFDLGRDVSLLFRAAGDNIFLFKFNYRFTL